MNLLLVSGKVVGVGPNHVEKLEISLLSSSSFHLRLFFYKSEHLFLNIFEQDLQPYEAKRVSCVPSRTPGRALRSRRQCTGSPAGFFMIKQGCVPGKVVSGKVFKKNNALHWFSCRFVHDQG